MLSLRWSCIDVCGVVLFYCRMADQQAQTTLLAQLPQLLAAQQLASEDTELRITVQKVKTDQGASSAQQPQQPAVTAADLAEGLKGAIAAELQPVAAGVGAVSQTQQQVLTVQQQTLTVLQQIRDQLQAQQDAAAAKTLRDAYMYQKQLWATNGGLDIHECVAKDILEAFMMGKPYKNDGLYSYDTGILCDLIHRLTGMRPRLVMIGPSKHSWQLHRQ